MKRQFSFLALVIAVFAASFIYAQAPKAFNYQAVIRDGSGNLITSGLIELKFTIRTGTSTGTVQYQETISVAPNQFGLVNHAVGTGVVVTGTMAGVTWSSGDKFLQVEVNTGSGLVDLGTQQLVSVPYAISSGDNQWTATGTDIKNNNTGNVGIGTSAAPNQKLDVNGGINVTGGIIQRGGNPITTTSDLGLYSRISGQSVRIVSNAGDISFYNTDASGIAGAGTGSTMVISKNGRVGIGAVPAFPLHVAGSISGTPLNTSGPESWFNPNSALQQSASATTTNVSIYATAYVASSAGFVAHSDTRLKNITGTSNTANDLQTLNKIEITDYTMRDSRADSSLFKKVIAQQVQSVYPQAVKNTAAPDFIANLYQLASNYTVNGNTLTITLAKAIEEKDKNDVVAGTEIKLYFNEKTNSKNIKEEVACIEAIKGNTIIVSVPDMPSDFAFDKVFVYGTKVSDLLSVDYEAIAMLNVSATQELYKLIVDLKVENASLKAELNTATSSLKADIEFVKAQLGIRSQNTTK